MNSLQLEQLISGYLDDELLPKQKREVKNLLQSDPAAKKLYEELESIRNEIRNIRRHNLPFDFQKQLFERIDRETVTISGKLVEQTTSVDFTNPFVTEPQPEWQDRTTIIKGKHWRSKLLERLKHPGVWAIPVVALVVGLTIFTFYPKDQDTAFVPPVQPIVDDPGDLPVEPDFPPPPLPDAGSISESATNHGLVYKNGKPIVEVTLKLSPTARDSQYIPKLLADSGYSYTIRENGTKPVTVYEFEIPAERLLPLILQLYSSPKEILEYKLPDGILTLLHRPAEPGLMEPTVEPTVIVHLNAMR